jgi:hypothetical protein
MKILVVKKKDSIIISCDGKKLLIDENSKLYDKLKELPKEDIKIWYETNRFNNLLDLNN